MTDKIVVLVTVADMREGKKIARHLLEKQLIACANIVPLVRSIYRWQGKITEDRECLLVIKTMREVFPALQLEIEKLHSYSVPEVIALTVVDGSLNYLNWITENVAVPEDTAKTA